MTGMYGKSLEERLADGYVIGAEGYVFELEHRGYIKAGPYVPEVVLDAPEAVLQLHREFLRAGADVMVALTYYANREKLKDVGRENDLEAMNRKAVQLASQAAQDGGALVAGNICNTWAYDPGEPHKSGAVVRSQFEEQVGWAVEEGIDFLIAETNDYLEEALIALEVAKSFNLSTMVTLATVQPEMTRDGYEYVDACKILADNGATIVGFNCDRGPTTLLPLVERVCAAVDCAVAVQPVPYRTTPEVPSFEGFKEDGVGAYPIGMEPFLCTRFEMAAFARQAADAGARYIGICCGGTPYYLRAMAEALGRDTTASKYSPALDLHPMMKDVVADKDSGFIDSWSGAR